MKKLANAWRWLWANHIQKVSAGILGTATLYDIVADLLNLWGIYQPEVRDLIGAQAYHDVRIVFIGLIFARAIIRPRSGP